MDVEAGVEPHNLSFLPAAFVAGLAPEGMDPPVGIEGPPIPPAGTPAPPAPPIAPPPMPDGMGPPAPPPMPVESVVLE